MSAFYNAFALVGGRYGYGLPAGLWSWHCWESSSGAGAYIGARLIIWELMCKSAVLL